MLVLGLGLDQEAEVLGLGLGNEGQVLGLGFGLVLGLEISRPRTISRTSKM